MWHRGMLNLLKVNKGLMYTTRGNPLNSRKVMRFCERFHSRGLKCFNVKGKINAHFISPYEIICIVGQIAYKQALQPYLYHVHEVFYIF